MYENYTRQALPSKKYRELLGAALCVFNANTQFIIENILAKLPSMSWCTLTDESYGHLLTLIESELGDIDTELKNVFRDLKERRHRIAHSFQITDTDGEQRLATKTKAPQNEQFVITENYLKEFIKDNESLCMRLYDIRDHIRKANNIAS